MSQASTFEPDPALADALANLYDAGAVKVPAWAALVTALASVRPEGIGATIDWLVAQRGALEQAYEGGRVAPLATAKLPPELHYTPELGFLDRARNDHALRERWLFAEIVGRRSWFQTTVYAITGLELEPRDAEFLEQVGIVNLTVDARAWPMAVTRRVAARGREVGPALVAGFAMLGSGMLAGRAAGDCARFLHRADLHEREGGSIAALVEQTLARRERVMGFGRPVVGPDERGPIMADLLVRYGRDQQRFVSLLRVVEQAFDAQRGLRTTAAAWAAAILSDYGMDPDQVEAVSNAWVAVNVFAQAAFSQQRGVGELDESRSVIANKPP